MATVLCVATRREQPAPSPADLPATVTVVVAAWRVGLLGVCCRGRGAPPDLAPLLLLAAMGVLSFQLREPTVTSRIGFSFLSIILLASGAIIGPFGAWFVGPASSVAIDRDRKVHWFQRALQRRDDGHHRRRRGLAYLLVGGPRTSQSLSGLPIIATRSACRSRRRRRPVPDQRRAPRPGSSTSTRASRSASSCGASSSAPASPTSATASSASSSSSCGSLPGSALQRGARPRAAARRALGLHPVRRRAALARRTVDTLVTALGTKEPAAVERSRRVAQARRVDRRGAGPRPAARSARSATPRRCTRSVTSGVPARLLRRPARTLSAAGAPRHRRHCVARRTDDRGHRLPRGGAFRHPAPARALRRARWSRTSSRDGDPDRRAGRLPSRPRRALTQRPGTVADRRGSRASVLRPTGASTPPSCRHAAQRARQARAGPHPTRCGS